MFFVAPPFQRCVEQAMGGRWRIFKLHYTCFVVLILSLGFRGSSSLNLEGSTLLKFRSRIDSDPYNSLASWNSEDDHPCKWKGVRCVDDKVHMLDLSGLSLEGTLTPELGYLDNLRSLILRGNRLSGAIPVEFGCLTTLEVLDLSGNYLTGVIPAEIANMVSLKRLLLSDNNFEGTIPPELKEHSLSVLQFDEHLASVTNRKFGHRPKVAMESWLGHGSNQIHNLETSYEPNMLQNAQVLATVARRKLIDQSNVEALPAKYSPVSQVTSQPVLSSSGSFPALVKEKSQSRPPSLVPSDSNSQQEKTPAQPAQSHANTEKPSQKVWVFVAIGLGVLFLLAVAAALYFMWRSRGARPIGPFKTGISGQLQKAFVTGVPKLNRSELETACEDFSNIIATFDAFTIYKGTLSSGVEIAVASTLVKSSTDWLDAAELAYRKKIETLSRVNHKNYVNLLGYCEENEPFTRMMVLEYAPSGSFFEHLHVKEVERLDWNARMRVIMGAAYCLQYMHHDLNPPVAHMNLRSSIIYLTDDYAAKLVEKPFDVLPEAKVSGEDGSKPSVSTKTADLRQNVYEFGILLLETITGRLPYSEEQGYLVDWALKYLNDRENNKDLIDPILKSIKTNELDVICDVILQCIKSEPSRRPTMKEVTTKLRQAIPITPDAAVPRLSPLWWAELEILSVEAS
ncbi:protein MALE DISCOVERER 1-like [Chenopodium quinoa]|uniref:protein MALE DISCOVERER 1-like n=1 Tax=Chenopodium quinoa TaxID=63459 RepID=UPI000B78DC2D|nr:protein MALE DISCOVERER 1-like [Chenopodium quinoa]XP_021766122.1 protein MALE DISCOVERER 1-like [Chenopodium quinoa]